MKRIDPGTIFVCVALFIAAFYAAFLMGVKMSMLDPDILWHIMMGRDICQTGHISTDNPYSWITGTTWNQSEWLYGVFIYFISQIGTSAYLGLYCLLLILAFLLGLRLNRGRIKVPWIYAAFFLLVFNTFSLNPMNRPGYFSSVLLPILFSLEERCMGEPAKGTKFMPFAYFGIGMFLANFHCGQGVVIGLFLALRLVTDAIYLLLCMREKWRLLLHKLLRIAVYFAGMCINPCGPAQLKHMFLTAGMQSTTHINEWRPMDLKGYWQGILVTLYLISVGYTVGRFILNEFLKNRVGTAALGEKSGQRDRARRMLSDTAALCALFVLTFSSYKSAIILVYLLIINWYPYFEHMVRAFVISLRGGWKNMPRFHIPKPVLLIALIAGILTAVLSRSQNAWSFRDYAALEISQKIGDEVLDSLRGKNYRIAHGYNLSDYLMWEGIPVCMDTRQQPYATESGVTEILDDIMELKKTDGDAIAALLDKYDINAVLVSPDFDIRWYLEREGSFRLLAEDEYGNSVWAQME